MTKKADTWMPWYVADYLADTAHLSTEQHGAYCLMLMAAWKRGGGLPKDDAQLASVCRLSAARWKAHRAILLDFFVEAPEAYLHKRVTEERQKAQAISEKKAKVGAEGAAKRWQRDDKSDGTTVAKGMADAIANATPKPSQTDAPSPSPSPAPSELEKEATASSSPAAPPTDGGGGGLFGGDEEVVEALPPCPHRRLLAMFRARVPELSQPRPELWEGSSGADAMRQRWKWLLSPDARREDGSRYATTAEEAVEWFGRFFDTVAETPFLMGRKTKWRADLQWLMKRENFVKVIEGRYDREGAAA